MRHTSRPLWVALLSAAVATAALGDSSVHAAGLRGQSQVTAKEEGSTVAQNVLLEEIPANAPPPASNSENLSVILKEIMQFLYNQIHNSAHQGLVALVALGIGLILLISGKKFYDGLIIAGMGVVAMTFAMNFTASVWEISVHSPVAMVTGIEVGLVAAYATWRGIDGMNIIVGTAFALFAAYRFDMMLAYMGVTVQSHWAIVVLFTAVVGTLMFMFKKEGHLTMLAFLCPILGGALIVSAVSCGITKVVLARPFSGMLRSLPNIHPVDGAWITFLTMLFELNVPDHGFYASSPYNIEGSRCTTDRICGWILWLVLVVVGWKLQKPFKRSKPVAPSGASARELAKTLLER